MSIVTEYTTDVLLIYEEVPENTYIFQLSVTEEEFAKLQSCHNWYVNLDGWQKNEDNLMWLESLIRDPVTGTFLISVPGRLKQVTLNRGCALKIDKVPTYVVHSGFIL